MRVVGLKLARHIRGLRNYGQAVLQYQVLVTPLFYTLFFLAFFSPSLFGGELLAIGADGQNLYLPNYYSPKVLWDPLLFAGFPMKADPQVMSWYPPAMLLSLLSDTWNVFILIAYILGTSFMCGYVYSVTSSRQAALFSGLTYGLSGFMIAHLGHAVILQSAAWIPLVLWSFERLRRGWSSGWAIAGSLGIAMSFLGGHTQIFAYGAMLSAAYALTVGWNSAMGRWRYFGVMPVIIVLGLGLAAIQILPTVELVQQSVRVGYGFVDFVSHSLPPHQIVSLIFPTLFGLLPEAGAPKYFGADNQTELTGYVGLLPLLLAVFGSIKWPEKRLVVFWICTAVLAVILATGDATPLAKLIYRVPILSQFRAPGRHLLEFTIAVTVLAGLGIASLKDRISPTLTIKVVLLGGLTILICILMVALNLETLVSVAAQKNIAQPAVVIWANRAIVVGTLLYVMAGAVVIWWSRSSASAWRTGLLFLVLILDLASFGWFYQWRYFPLREVQLKPSATVLRYKHELTQTHQRLLPSRGVFSDVTEMPPNLSRLWGVPSATGYNSLLLMRPSRLLALSDIGIMTAPLWWEPNDQSLNVASVRYLSLPHSDTISKRGIMWNKDDMQMWLGSGCNQPPRSSVRFELPTPVRTDEVGIVSSLACSSQITNNTEVARIRLIDSNGKEEAHRILAGRDSSEWAYDCKSVTPHMKHQKAAVFSSYSAKMYDESCPGNLYVMTLNLDVSRNLKTIEVDWVSGSGSLILEKISLIDRQRGLSVPVNPITANKRWRLVESTKTAAVYENLEAMPRVWVVPEVITLPPLDVLAVLRTSKLPDGRVFDPRGMALLEERVDGLLPTAAVHSWQATISELSATFMEIRTSTTMPSLLITSDVFYPGWRATIDGVEAPIFRTNFAFRGVLLPSGDHVVKFEYRPRSFYWGMATSTFSLVLLGCIALNSFRRQ